METNEIMSVIIAFEKITWAYLRAYRANAELNTVVRITINRSCRVFILCHWSTLNPKLWSNLYAQPGLALCSCQKPPFFCSAEPSTVQLESLPQPSKIKIL